MATFPSEIQFPRHLLVAARAAAVLQVLGVDGPIEALDQHQQLDALSAIGTVIAAFPLEAMLERLKDAERAAFFHSPPLQYHQHLTHLSDLQTFVAAFAPVKRTIERFRAGATPGDGR